MLDLGGYYSHTGKEDFERERAELRTPVPSLGTTADFPACPSVEAGGLVHTLVFWRLSLTSLEGSVNGHFSGHLPHLSHSSDLGWGNN